MKKLLRSQKGFTLIEILLVVAAIAILAGIVIVAINPSKQLGDTRNAKRRSDVTNILNATYQYAIDHNGVIPSGVTLIPTEICASGIASTTCAAAGLVSLEALSVGGTYLTDIPLEDNATTTNGAGYRISKNANGRITVSAGFAEQSAIISQTK